VQPVSTTTQVGLYIDGNESAGATGESFVTEDPATGEAIARVARAGRADVDRAIDAAEWCLSGPWREAPPRRRVELLSTLADLIEDEQDDLARTEMRDSGKPLWQARREVASSARYFRYYAGAADKIHGEQIPLGPEYVDFTIREPVGVTAHIVPWNAPFNMVARSVAPALACGCTVVVKPAMETPLTAIRLGHLMRMAGFPDGAYNAVPGPGPEVGAYLARLPRVGSITFTGSVATGRLVMRAASEHVRPVVLELGGKSPSIVLADADLDVAADEIVKGIYRNSGQFCNASSRVVVDRAVEGDLLDRLVSLTRRVTVGPGEQDPDIGPLVSARQLDRVLGYIAAGRDEGARVVVGGGRIAELERGHFVAPTILDQVAPTARVAQEEIFGPVMSIHSFAQESEALAIANDVAYGLAAGIFTRDIDRALRLATRVQAGQIYVNEYFAGGEETPFGGYKQSGFGREKGLEALRNYTQVKNIAIRIGGLPGRHDE
jgi:aldehyde dehydrogenase (NAD+)